VAYAGLLGDRRRDLHAAVMAAIERLHADRLVEHVERLAHHARQGEVWDKAARYLRQAGAKVFLRSANREAAVYLEQALDALRRLPEHPDAIAESLDIRFDLRNALNVLGESGRIGALLDEAQALAEAVGDERRLGRALNYKVIQLGRAGDLAAAIQTGLRALAIGESQADVAIQVVANLNLGQVYVAWGECREAVRHCEAAVALIPEGLAQERFGQAAIPGSTVRSFLAIALGELGRFAEAFGRLREALHIAEEAGHVYTLVFPLFSLGFLELDQGDFAGALAPLERGLELCRTREVPWLLPHFAGALGAAYHGTGRCAEGVALMEDAARGLVAKIVALVAWPGRVWAPAGRTSSTGGWRTPLGSPRTGSPQLGSGGNGAWRATSCDCSATSRPTPTASRSIPRRRTIARPWPWPRRWGPYCSRATASVPLSRPAGHDQPASPALLIPPPEKAIPSRCRAGFARRVRAFWNAYPLAYECLT
jgi:tetratricopeptide (TPR) repeat protein